MAAPAHASAPSEPPPGSHADDHTLKHTPGGQAKSGASTDATVEPFAETLPYPVQTGMLDDGLGVWVYADTASAGNWTVTVYNMSGEMVAGPDPVRPKQRVNFPITTSGGWHDIYLTDYVSHKEVYVDSFNIEGSFKRLAGANRFETSAAVSFDTFSGNADVAYVANAYNFPDALSGAAVAGVKGAPVLLTRADTLSDAIRMELDRLQPAKIVLLGGTGAVSNTVKTQLAGYTTGGIQRLGGANRFETSALISQTSFSPGVPVAYVANAYKFPDALSGAAAAGKLGGPVLLTAATSLPAAIATELDRLNPAKIVILGGAAAVTDGVEAQLASYTSGPVERYAGANRFETSAAISAHTFEPNVPVVYLANAYNFPDALSGAAAAGTLGGPVLLTAAGSLSPAVEAELTRLNPRRIIVLGGDKAISPTYATTELHRFAAPIVLRGGGSYVDGPPTAAGPTISNVVIVANSLSVTVSFDYTHPADWWTPVFVGIYPGTPTDYPYGDFDPAKGYGLNDGWSGWMYMTDAVSGHASQSFRVTDDGPLTVMLFGSKLCECVGGTDFIKGRDFEAVP
jgi:putative cell wall-binding protein